MIPRLFKFVPLAAALTLSAPVLAQVQYGSDPGASGVVDGTDVYQFLTSGPVIDPVRMEEASRKFDRVIKLPTRQRQAKSWAQEIERERTGKSGSAFNTQYMDPRTAPDSAERGGYRNASSEFENSAPISYQGFSQASGASNSSAQGSATGTEQVQATTGPHGTATNMSTSATASASQNPAGASAINAHYQQILQKHDRQRKSIFGRMGMAFLRTCDFVGFPVADEFLPGDVDASLAGDLPPGTDPRVYVHEDYARKALAEHQKPQEQVHEQSPTIIIPADGSN